MAAWCTRLRSGAKVLALDEASVAALPGVRVVRIADFVGVVSADEWAAVRAARELKIHWSDSAPLIGHEAVVDWARKGPFVAEEVIAAKGDALRVAALRDAPDVLRASYSWPIQSHGSIGPSCAVADVRADGGTVWTASQASHRFQNIFAALVDLPRDKLRVIYLDGAGCYGMNGHDDAAADAVLLSKAVGRPVRVQWSREDELGWDPKGPPQLLDLQATLAADGRIDAWQTDMWVPRATANLEWIPLLSPLAAGLRQPVGQSVGLVSQNGDPPYPANAVKVTAHWLGPAPLRPSNIRAPGKVANCFAVESFVDELAAKAKADPLAFRLRDLANPRGVAVIQRVAQMIGWQAAAVAAGRERGHAQRPGAGAGHGLHPLQAQRDLRRRRDGGRRRSQQRRDRGAPRLLRPRLRADDQSRRGARPGRRQHPADPVANAVRRNHLRPLARDQRRLGQLPAAAFPAGAGDRDRAHRPPRPAAAGRRRGGLQPGARGAGERGVRCHRRAPAQRAVHPLRG